MYLNYAERSRLSSVGAAVSTTEIARSGSLSNTRRPHQDYLRPAPGAPSMSRNGPRDLHLHLGGASILRNGSHWKLLVVGTPLSPCHQSLGVVHRSSCRLSRTISSPFILPKLRRVLGVGSAANTLSCRFLKSRDTMVRFFKPHTRALVVLTSTFQCLPRSEKLSMRMWGPSMVVSWSASILQG